MTYQPALWRDYFVMVTGAWLLLVGVGQEEAAEVSQRL